MGTEASRGTLVYLGPSLCPVRARQIFAAADYRPPIRRGDLPEQYDGTVIIIDGEFRQSLSVSPNEILRLLDQGTRVIGAASMGALRAMELGPYGMQGVGWVAEAYRSGRIIADDEVAVTYAPEGYPCLTVPLVNIRRWIDDLEEHGDLDRVTARRMLRPARALFYADRSEAVLLETWTTLIGGARLRRLLRATGGAITDAKAADAELVLALAASAEAHAKGEQQWQIPANGNPSAPPLRRSSAVR